MLFMPRKGISRTISLSEEHFLFFVYCEILITLNIVYLEDGLAPLVSEELSLTS